MLEDTQKQLWVISENSISKFNPQQGTFENYGSNYFQRELNLTEAVPTLTSQKKIVLGTNQGILEINTEQMKKKFLRTSYCIYRTQNTRKSTSCSA